MSERKEIPEGMRIAEYRYDGADWRYPSLGRPGTAASEILDNVANHLINGDPIDYELPRKKRRVVEWEDSTGTVWQSDGDKFRYGNSLSVAGSWHGSGTGVCGLAKMLLEYAPYAPCVKEIDDD